MKEITAREFRISFVAGWRGRVWKRTRYNNQGVADLLNALPYYERIRVPKSVLDIAAKLSMEC